jgi:hypothetical protein
MIRLHPTHRGAETVALPLGTLARLAQDEESERSGGDAGGRRGMGQKETAMTEAGKNRIIAASREYVFDGREL